MSDALVDRLKARIAQDGPMSVAEYMMLALHDPRDGYYARHARLGGQGDFLTAPEVSQMFGELVGLWCAQSWMDMGAPSRFDVIELGPGTGALASDVMRAAKAAPEFAAAVTLTLVEESSHLRAVQQERLGSRVRWASRLSQAPEGPGIVLGNEFLDCLPIRQFVRTETHWRERMIGLDEGGALAFGLGAPMADAALLSSRVRAAPVGSVAEVAVALSAVVEEIAMRLRTAPGRALFIDYGESHPAPGDTLQAVRAHRREGPLDAPGRADLTAHVDFEALVAAAQAAGLDVAGPAPQGLWLRALGVDARAEVLAKARPDKADEIARQRARLVDDDAMGALFKVVCLSSPGLPPPAGFES